MDSQESLWQKYSPFIKQNLLVLVLGFLGLIFLGYGLIQYLGQKGEANEIVFEKAPEQEENSTIVVDVAGAVVKPGVYKLISDGRIQDALIAAGGFSNDADRAWVDRNVNLAAKLNDGTKLYIPFIGDPAERDVLSSSGLGSSSIAYKQINVNTASQSELETLSGVGQVTAEKIIANRPYSSIDELLTKKVVGKSVFEKIKEKIIIY